MSKSLLLAGVGAAAVVVSGVEVYADDAVDIEAFYGTTAYVQYDNTGGLDPNGYPVITAIASQPGTFGGHLYTGWSVLAQDQTGSLDLFISQFTLTNMRGSHPTSLKVGDGVNVAGQWSPFHQIPELSFSTVPSSNNYFTTVSTGNVLPTPPVATVAQLNVNNISNNLGLAGYFLEIQNATISGSTGSFQSVFPNYAQANIASESYTITDNTGSMTMFDWVTSYSQCGELGGMGVPTGPVDITGFVSYNTGGPAEFTPVVMFIPEPSAFVLAGLGLAGLLTIRRRRS